MKRDEFLVGNAAYLKQRDVDGLKSKLREWVPMNHCDIYGAVTEKRFLPTISKGRYLLADAITGTLYDATTGVCLSSSQMKLVVATGEAVVTVKPGRKRKTTEAKEAAGWINDKRRAAA